MIAPFYFEEQFLDQLQATQCSKCIIKDIHHIRSSDIKSKYLRTNH